MNYEEMNEDEFDVVESQPDYRKARGILNLDPELGVVQDIESTLMPDNHTVKARGVWLMDGDTKTLFYESGAVADLQHELSLARERIALLEQTEQLLLKRIKALKNKSEDKGDSQ